MTMRGSRWMVLFLMLCLGPQSLAAVSIAGCLHPASVQAPGDVPSVPGEHAIADSGAARGHPHEWSADTARMLIDCPCGCTCFDRGCGGGMTPAAVSMHRHDFPARRDARPLSCTIIDTPAPFPSELIRPPNPA